MKSKPLFIAIISLLIGLSSCSNKIVKAYYGPKRDKTSVAFVKGNFSGGSSIIEETFTLLYQVDSIPVTIGKHQAFPKRCAILPGTHTIETWFATKEDSCLRGRLLVSFDAEAGKTYTIDATTTHNHNVDVFVTDDKGNRVVSTVKNKFCLKGKE